MWPFNSVTRPAKNSHCAAAVPASRTISRTGLPQLAASSIANSSAFSRSLAATFFISAARSRGFTARQDLYARCAAVTAASTSCALASAQGPRLFPVAGLSVSWYPPVGFRHAPS